ncbi:MAG: hypothetical protein IJ780_00600 [Neisseriaceae bacterium]|nr:hypothetical protein [Neisseriaceae bacterium]
MKNSVQYKHNAAMSVLCQARSLEYSNYFLIDSNISGCLKTVAFLQKNIIN